MKRYALFGGTFDPFTPGHREIVKSLIDKKAMDGKPFYDKVWIAPTVVDYYRIDKKPWLSDKERLHVIEEMLSDLNRGTDWQLFDRDIVMKSMIVGEDVRNDFVKNRRFLDTLLDFKTSICQPNDIVHVVIGSDSLCNFKKWYMWKEILNQATLVVVPGRDGSRPSNAAIDGISYMDMPISDKFKNCSASAYREKYQYAKPDGVASYIKEVVKPTVEGSTLLLSTPIFDVVKGKPVDEVGGLEPIKVKAPDWVMAIVEHDGRLLVETQLRFGSMEYVQEFPCGMVEKDESPVAAAARELREETGILVGVDELVYLGSMNPNPAFMTNMMHLYYANLDHLYCANIDKTSFNRIVERKLDEHERIDIAWIDKKEFIETVINKATTDPRCVPALLLSAIALYSNKQR